MQNTKYTPKYFIKKFEQIPEKKWCVNTRADGQGRHCALGHTEVKGWETEETRGLSSLFEKGKAPEDISGSWAVANINNGRDHYLHLGKTPKQRILNALYAKLREGISIK